VQDARFRKSTASGCSQTACVEVARLRGDVAVRDSKSPLARLTFPEPAWAAFLVDVRHRPTTG
jgi:Domain of unknown function (DUF397)